MGLKIHPGLPLGHIGQKVIFTKKCYFSFRLHSMVMGLMHVHKLENFYLCYGVKIQPGVTLGSQWSKGHFHQKCYSSPM